MEILFDHSTLYFFFVLREAPLREARFGMSAKAKSVRTTAKPCLSIFTPCSLNANMMIFYRKLFLSKSKPLLQISLTDLRTRRHALPKNGPIETSVLLAQERGPETEPTQRRAGIGI